MLSSTQVKVGVELGNIKANTGWPTETDKKLNGLYRIESTAGAMTDYHIEVQKFVLTFVDICFYVLKRVAIGFLILKFPGLGVPDFGLWSKILR